MKPYDLSWELDEWGRVHLWKGVAACLTLEWEGDPPDRTIKVSAHTFNLETFHVFGFVLQWLADHEEEEDGEISVCTRTITPA